jgi:hypothetical protein
MATDVSNPENMQQFADDEIVDNYAGPDDGTPLGLGGEKGKQSSPASSTLEADMVAEPTKQEEKPSSDVDIPPESVAASGEPKPVQPTAGDDGKATAEPKTPEEPEASEFPDMLLQMAGFSSAEDARKFGFKDPEALLAAIQWQTRTLAQPVKPSRTSYLEPPKTPQAQPTTIPAETPPQGDDLAFKPFKPANPEIFDEELLKLIEAQNQHNAAQFEQLASRLQGRDAVDQQRQIIEQVEQFDQTVQGLGPEWEAEFGKGSGEALFGHADVESVSAAQNRLDLFDAVNLLRRTNAERGGKPMTVQQEVQWALMQRYPDKFRQQLLRQDQAKAASRRGTQASRPTARTTPLGTRNERLLSSLQTKYPGVDFSAPGEVEGDI